VLKDNNERKKLKEIQKKMGKKNTKRKPILKEG
jgi:hypothetical protein